MKYSIYERMADLLWVRYVQARNRITEEHIQTGVPYDLSCACRTTANTYRAFILRHGSKFPY